MSVRINHRGINRLAGLKKIPALLFQSVNEKDVGAVLEIERFLIESNHHRIKSEGQIAREARNPGMLTYDLSGQRLVGKVAGPE